MRDGARNQPASVPTAASVTAALTRLPGHGAMGRSAPLPRRTHEIGIRMAIGARPSDVLRLVMGKGVVLVGMGTVIGLAMGFAVEQLMNSMLFNAGGVDISAYLIVVPSMFLVTTLAAYVPARRASRIAPTEALRYE